MRRMFEMPTVSCLQMPVASSLFRHTFHFVSGMSYCKTYSTLSSFYFSFILFFFTFVYLCVPYSFCYSLFALFYTNADE